MHKRHVVLLAVVAIAAALGLSLSQRFFAPPAGNLPARPATKAVTLFDTPRPVPAFSLQQADGSRLDAAELQGHWTLVFLGFTHCPDVCPTTLAQLAGAQKRWASLPAATRPRVLFVSADPERDSPQLVGQYAHAFHPDTLAATAPIPQLQAFTRSLSLVFMKVPGASGAADDYSIDHSAALVLLDPQARMAGVVQPPLDIPGITNDLATLTRTRP